MFVCIQACSLVRLFALLCVVYVAQSAGELHRSQIDEASKDIDKRSTDEDKRGFRPDLGKRDDEDDDDDGRQQLLQQLHDRQERAISSFRGDLGKRRSSFRGDLGKRPFRGDLGKRANVDAEKRPFRGDLGKRRSSFRGDLGKRYVPVYGEDNDVVWVDLDEDDFSKRRSSFRGDLGKRRASFRGDLGK